MRITPLDPIKNTFKSDPFAKFHKYWARKPLSIASHYLETFTSKGDLVLDPFMGSGTTLYASMLSERDSIGFDLNPTACFLANTLCKKPISVSEFDNGVRDLTQSIGLKINSMYSHNNSTILWRSMTKNEAGNYKAQVSNFDFTNKVVMNIQIMEKTEARSSYLSTEFPPLLKDRFSSRGIRTVADMFTGRNLEAIELLETTISRLKSPIKEHLLICLNNSILHVSKLKGEGIRPLGVNSYWIPSDSIEENLWWRFLERTQNYRKSLKSLNDMREGTKVRVPTIHNSSSLSMESLKDSSIDYIFTDPPYGETIQYSELSFIWNTFLKGKYKVKEELIVNSVQGKSANSYLDLAKLSLKECFRVLKPGKHMTIAFQSKDIQLWVGLSVILAEQGFALSSIEMAAPKGSPFTSNWAAKAPKNDFYITVLKPHKHSTPTLEGVSWADFSSSRKSRRESKNALHPQVEFQKLVGEIFELPFEGIALFDVPKNSLSRILEA